MISDDDIDELTPDEEELTHSEDSQARPRKSIGFKTLLAGMIIAAGGGAVGGAFLSKLITPAPPAAVKTDLSVVNSSLDALARENKALKSQLSSLQKQAKSAPVDLSPLRARLEALELAAENAAPPVIDKTLLARLEALQGEGSPALDLSDITQRLTALESAAPEQGTQEKFKDLYARQAELSTKIDSALMSEAPPAQVISSALPPFPEAEIRAALAGMNKSEGWAKRTLNKHISVRSEGDPESLIDGIKLDLEKGDAEAAASKFDRLPSQLRSAGQAWRAAIKP